MGLGPPDPLRTVRAVLDDPSTGVPERSTVLVAVSGGGDSVGLLHLVVAARPDLEVVVGHIRHGLRDDADDARAARANAELLGLHHLQQAVVPDRGSGPEDAARRARYVALRRMATEVGAVAVMVGHTMDDQAETILLRLARGTGIAGLAGMRTVSSAHDVPVVRPMLGLRRAAVRHVAAGHPRVEDPTNDDPDQRRARARHEVIPALRRLHPADADVVPLLARLADLASLESDGLDAVAARIPLGRYGPAVLVPRHTGAVPDPPAVMGRLLRRGWAALDGPLEPPPHTVVDQALGLANGRSVTGPGEVTITASQRGWVLCPPVVPPPEVLLLPGGRVRLATLGVDLTCHESVAEGVREGGDGRVTGDRVVLGGQVPAIAPLDPLPWRVEVVGTPPLHITWRGQDGARDARGLLQQMVPHGLRHLVPLIRDDTGRLLAVGSRPVDPPPSGMGCLVLVGYPADP